MSETPIARRRRVHGAWTPEGETAPPRRRSARTRVIAVLKTVFDPEIPVDIYELGLIYAVEIADDGKVKVEMTLTTPSCPSAQELPSQVEEAVRAGARRHRRDGRGGLGPALGPEPDERGRPPRPEHVLTRRR